MKRFTETEKWRDPWFRSLSAPSKLVFLYVLDNCNNAGFLELDKELIVIFTKMKSEHLEGALQGLKRGIIEADGWLWVRRFLRHQKNEALNPENPAHKQIISLLRDQEQRFGKIQDFKDFIAPYLGLVSSKGTGQVKEKVRKRKSPEKEKQAELIYGAYPKKVAKPDAIRAILKALDGWPYEKLFEATSAYSKARNGDLSFVPHPASWFNDHRFNDDPSTWLPNSPNGKHKPTTKLDEEYDQWKQGKKEKTK